MNEADWVGQKTVTRRKKAVCSTAKLTALNDFLCEEGKCRVRSHRRQRGLCLADRAGNEGENVSRNDLAQRMKTSRSQIGRLLDPKDGNIAPATLQRAMRIVGRSLRLELV